jgi:hypothetical protein
MATGKERRAVRCGSSGQRLDAACRHIRPALRVALPRPPGSSRPSTVATATAFGRAPAGSTRASAMPATSL